MKSLIIRFILDPLIDWSVTLKYKWTIKKQLEDYIPADRFPEGIYYMPISDFEEMIDQSKTLH